jgi:outer membrane protein assembly factor BamE (lipoprotein component of BamABCDE complex)
MLLRIGMTKAEVLQVVGKPNLIEVDEDMEWWLYLMFVRKYVPLVFKEGQLVGWGESYWNNVRRSDKLESQPITSD